MDVVATACENGIDIAVACEDGFDVGVACEDWDVVLNDCVTLVDLDMACQGGDDAEGFGCNLAFNILIKPLYNYRLYVDSIYVCVLWANQPKHVS